MLLTFDYDGVIVDSFEQLLRMAQQAQGAIGDGRPPTPEDFQTIENLTFDDLGRRIGIAEENVLTFANRVLELQTEQWEVSVFPEIVPVFQYLAKRNTLVVITSSQGDAVEASLTDFGLGRAVSKVLGGESRTSKAQRISDARVEFSFSLQDTLMVGDAISDIRQGKLAGVSTVAVTWGFQDRKLLENESPDFIIDYPQDLLTIAV